MLDSQDYKRVTNYEQEPKEGEHVIIAFSGGLDSLVVLKMLIEKYKANVHAVCVDIGQREDLETVKQKALSVGAVTCDIIDVKDDYAEKLCLEAILFNADYEDGYHLFCPLGRIAIASVLVQCANKYDCKIIVHNSTGKGNDQIRFDGYITTLNPELKIMAPVREWSMNRVEEIAYAKLHNLPVTATLEKIYSYDENLWGCSSEGGAIEDFKKVPPLNDILKFTNLPEGKSTPDEPEYIKIAFLKGKPIAIRSAVEDSVGGSMQDIIKFANEAGRKHGIGITHLIEDRVIGLKVRGIYEEPGAELLIKAHKALEKAVSTREEILFKEKVDREWSTLIYSGKYLHPLIESLRGFCISMNYNTTGTVTMKLFKGRVEAVAIDSSNSLNNEAASFVEDGGFNQNSSAGFIEHYNYIQKLTFNLNAKNLAKK